ncbi:ABC transporter permease [Pseudodesulfovibrio sp.]|uniref:ABC transporter permease n=1 Tax=Pseudodesulfovibrio sp. TaxID=2035812 RepID=UPI002607943B|nr:ABC transporter permease [Pseudodesulfovibrio sp.]MDD3312816.1 ABC transporter permease [Pseudodesulfovibrio sp.]
MKSNVPQPISPSTPPGAAVSAGVRSGVLTLTLSGGLDAPGTTAIWDEAVRLAETSSQPRVEADLGGVRYLDGAGVALLLKLRDAVAARGGALTLVNLDERYVHLVDAAWRSEFPEWKTGQRERRGLAEALGQATCEMLLGLREMVTFTGEASAMTLFALRHPSKIRWKDVLLSCANVGVNSLFIISLIGFLMGLIMSFQSAVSLQRFGGEIFIPNMLGLIMFREMGPLVTAILLAARSGSAFAAEIGTMKINEELDALTTMGLSPMRFLVIPKLLSALAMVPIMTMFFNLASLVGGAVVMLSLGFPLVTFTSRVFTYLNYAGFWGGMLKAVVFAILVAGVGCLRGMQTRTGASAVGLSTTSAVVSGIVAIAFADGIFAVAYYYLGI